MIIKCSAVSCLFNNNQLCIKEQIAIAYKEFYQWDKIIERVPICMSYSSKEIKGRMDFSQFPKR